MRHTFEESDPEDLGLHVLDPQVLKKKSYLPVSGQVKSEHTGGGQEIVDPPKTKK